VARKPKMIPDVVRYDGRPDSNDEPVRYPAHQRVLGGRQGSRHNGCPTLEALQTDLISPCGGESAGVAPGSCPTVEVRAGTNRARFTCKRCSMDCALRA